MIRGGESQFGVKVRGRGGEDLQLVCNIYQDCIFFSSLMVCLISWMMFVLTGMKFVVNQPIFVDVRFDKNEICTESTNNCGFLTFSFAFISFVVSG